MEMAGALAKASRRGAGSPGPPWPPPAPAWQRPGWRGVEAGELVEEGAGAKHEDAAVPEVAARLQVARRSLPVGLLHEGLDDEGVIEARQRVAAADVAVAGVRPGRRDAEQHEPARRGHLARPSHGGDEARLVLDDVVGGHQHQDALGIVCGHQKRGDSGCRGGVAGHRLEHDGLGHHAGALGLLPDQEPVVVVADDDRRAQSRRRGRAASAWRQGSSSPGRRRSG